MRSPDPLATITMPRSLPCMPARSGQIEGAGARGKIGHHVFVRAKRRSSMPIIFTQLESAPTQEPASSLVTARIGSQQPNSLINAMSVLSSWNRDTLQFVRWCRTSAD